MPARYSLDRGTRMTVTSGKCAGCQVIVEANVFHRTVDRIICTQDVSRLESRVGQSVSGNFCLNVLIQIVCDDYLRIIYADSTCNDTIIM